MDGAAHDGLTGWLQLSDRTKLQPDAIPASLELAAGLLYAASK